MLVTSLSVVIPFYNETENIAPLFDRLLPVVTAITQDWEVVCVDDGSEDETFEKLQAFRARDPRIKLLKLSRNFGKEAAISAGLSYAGGAHVLVMDGDLQHPPEVLPDMIKLQLDGFDVIYGVRGSRQSDGTLRTSLSRLFYPVFSAFSETDIPPDVGDFRLMTRRVVLALNALPEKTRFMKGLYAWVGFSHHPVEFDVAPRVNGNSKWSLPRLFGYGWTAIVSFSALPLRLCSVVGFAIATLALFYAIWIGLSTVLFGRDVPGYATLAVAIFFLGGLQLIGIGLLGEYIARIFTEAKGRPLFIVEEADGFESSE
ncbi:MAG: glycosyltransferase family 2 protein [Pseudomonadota bacterium]